MRRTSSRAVTSATLPSANTAALMHHGDALGDVAHEGDIMLHDHNGSPSRVAIAGTAPVWMRFAGRHAGGGLVQQQDVRARERSAMAISSHCN